MAASVPAMAQVHLCFCWLVTCVLPAGLYCTACRCSAHSTCVFAVLAVPPAALHCSVLPAGVMLTLCVCCNGCGLTGVLPAVLHFTVLPAGVVLTPCVLYWLWPPAISSTPHAPAAAAARLQEMGPLTADEGVMIGAVTLAVGLWVSDGVAG
jgi:hypothetical protein